MDRNSRTSMRSIIIFDLCSTDKNVQYAVSNQKCSAKGGHVTPPLYLSPLPSKEGTPIRSSQFPPNLDCAGPATTGDLSSCDSARRSLALSSGHDPESAFRRVFLVRRSDQGSAREKNCRRTDGKRHRRFSAVVYRGTSVE